MEKKPMTKVCGLWAGKENSKILMSGSFTYGTRLVVLKNDFKASPKDPDFNLFLAEAEKKPKEADQATPAPINLDDVPF